jgi:SPP1 gp7 family putative phage head morphogenesis protein
MTTAQQNKYWRNWHRFQQKNEKKYEAKFNKALQLQVDAYIRTQDLMAIPLFPIYEVINDLYRTVGPSWVKQTYKGMTKADGRLGFNERIIELMRQYYGIDLLNDASGITDYTRAVIQKVLDRAAIEGWSPDRIVYELRTNSELSTMRARRIARTETVTAANQAAMLYASESGFEMEKVWIAVKDKRTRHNHKTIDGTQLDIGEAFPLAGGTVLMQQPGARTQENGLASPASEVVNCRCVVAFQAKRDANGRLIMTR